MKTINVKDAIDRQPFKPLIVELDNGKQLKIPHRDFVSLNPSGSTAVIFEEEHVHIVDIDHISAITLERGSRASR
ncbi:MAG: hypothetical protein M3Y82_08830 [Verrucomicrobiota bacterium]|nr:hypothetical protein [Verrucomicrobiota bacterium]